jgi:hypothetical protein
MPSYIADSSPRTTRLISGHSHHLPRCIYELKPELYKKLALLRYTKFTPGHAVLLARAISNSIALPSTPVPDFNAWFLSKKLEVMSVIDRVSEFMFVEDKEAVVLLTRGFTQWRHSLVVSPPSPLFMRGVNNVVDELSSLGKFVDTVYLCKVADIYEQANHLYSVFAEIVMVK